MSPVMMAPRYYLAIYCSCVLLVASASPVPSVGAGALEQALEVVAAAFRQQNDTELKALLTHMDVNDDEDKDDK